MCGLSKRNLRSTKLFAVLQRVSIWLSPTQPRQNVLHFLPGGHCGHRFELPAVRAWKICAIERLTELYHLWPWICDAVRVSIVLHTMFGWQICKASRSTV